MKVTLLASGLIAVLMPFAAAQDSHFPQASLDREVDLQVRGGTASLSNRPQQKTGPPSYCKPCLFSRAILIRTPVTPTVSPMSSMSASAPARPPTPLLSYPGERLGRLPACSPITLCPMSLTLRSARMKSARAFLGTAAMAARWFAMARSLPL